jgi:hypothetical protein
VRVPLCEGVPVPLLLLVCVGVMLPVPLAVRDAVLVGGMYVEDAVGVAVEERDAVVEGVGLAVPVPVPDPVDDWVTVDEGVGVAELVDEGVAVAEGDAVPVGERDVLGVFEAVGLAVGVTEGVVEGVGVTVLHTALPSGVVEPAAHARHTLPAEGA